MGWTGEDARFFLEVMAWTILVVTAGRGAVALVWKR